MLVWIQCRQSTQCLTKRHYESPCNLFNEVQGIASNTSAIQLKLTIQEIPSICSSLSNLQILDHVGQSINSYPTNQHTTTSFFGLIVVCVMFLSSCTLDSVGVTMYDGYSLFHWQHLLKRPHALFTSTQFLIRPSSFSKRHTMFLRSFTSILFENSNTLLQFSMVLSSADNWSNICSNP